MLNTPDLSQEFHPVPKVYKAKKTPKPLKKMGKKTQAWNDIRAIVKGQFEKVGIVTCELKRPTICWRNNALTFAHPDKRVKIKEEDLHIVILACTPCHQWLEPRKDMPDIVSDIIKSRTIQPTNDK